MTVPYVTVKRAVLGSFYSGISAKMPKTESLKAIFRSNCISVAPAHSSRSLRVSFLLLKLPKHVSLLIKRVEILTPLSSSAWPHKGVV